MSLERWNATKHLPLVHEWTRLRKLGDDAGDVLLMPPTGFVADGIVAGFLFLTNSKLGFMDSFISDPRATKEARGAAIEQIMEAIIRDARELGLHALAGSICVPSLAAHVTRCGFTMIPNCQYTYRKV